MPSEAAHDPAIAADLVAAGMNVMRINCAHDGPAAWKKMIAHARHAERALGRTCRVQADLPGPKLRTGGLEPGARVVKLKPEVAAVEFLSGVLERMDAHQSKKMAMLRRLSISGGLHPGGLEGRRGS